MDVEGAEQNALRGAEGVILKQRPLLAVSIYHKAPDIWDIPHYLKRLLGNCRIHFRHHTGLFYDTICYATATEG